MTELIILYDVCKCMRFHSNYFVLFSVDVTVYHRGFHGDLNETFLVGNISPVGRKLTQVTWECLDKAINIG